MYKRDFLHKILTSANKIKNIVEEGRLSVEQAELLLKGRKMRITEAEEQLDILFKIINAVAQNLPDKLEDIDYGQKMD